MSTKDGGPAFPCTYTILEQSPYGAGQIPRDIQSPGMTLRDYFAATADIPWNACIETLMLKGVKSPTIFEVISLRVELKFQEADAMLKAREA